VEDLDVTTIPLPTATQTAIKTFWEAVLSEQDRVVNVPRMDGERRTDPMWALVLVVLGSMALVGSGAFLITIGLSR
jgi:hypothetical protein